MPRKKLDWLLWHALHLVFALFCMAGALVARFRELVSSLSAEAGDVKTVRSSRPLAVAVAFESQEAVDSDGKIPRLLLWLSMVNVSHITLYDAEGKLKGSKEDLQKILDLLETEDENGRSNSEGPGLPSQKRNQLRRRWEVQSRNDKDMGEKQFEKRDSIDVSGNNIRRRETDENVTQEGGFRAEEAGNVRRIVVELLSLQDGKQALVRAARHVCENAYKSHYAEQSAKKTKLTEDDINKSLQATGGDGPDPDLLLLFGMTRSLLGFPPWRIRLTEIVHMGSLKDLTSHSFVNALKVFSKKTHRYGR